MKRLSLLVLLLLSFAASGFASAAPPRLTGKKPNIVFILTDDQGYGDLSAHGNPILKTPNIDRLHAAGRSLHRLPRQPDLLADALGPADRPARVQERRHAHHPRTRAADAEGATLAQVLKSAGYTTGIFGKWHLGDEPDRWPSKRGFDEMFIHGGGGIGQTYPGSCGDAPGNTYFDPAILHNGKFEKTKGYCTDVFFAQATKWIESVKGKQPFFCYIPTNAPHAPLQVRPEDEARYTDKVKRRTRPSSSA